MDTMHPHLKKRDEYLKANPRLKELFDRVIPLYELGKRCDGRVIGKERAGLPNTAQMIRDKIKWPHELDAEFNSGRSEMLDPYRVLNAIDHKYESTQQYLDTKTALSKSVKTRLLKTFLIARVGRGQNSLAADLECRIEHLYWVDLSETKQFRFLLDDSVKGILEGDFLRQDLGVIQLVRSYTESDVYLRSTTIPESWLGAVADELYRYGLVIKNHDGGFEFANFPRASWISDIDRWIAQMMEEAKATHKLANHSEFRYEFDRLIKELEGNVASVSRSKLNHHSLHCHAFAWKKTKNHSDEIFQRAKKLSCPYLQWRHLIVQMDRLYSPLYDELIDDENTATINSWKLIQELLANEQFQPRRFKKAITELVQDRFVRLFDDAERRKASVFNKKRSVTQGS